MSTIVTFVINSIGEESAVAERFRESVEFFESQGIRYNLPKESADEEYDPEALSIFLTEVKDAWEADAGEFLDRLGVLIGRETSDITVRVTQYGPIGTYDLADRSVTINRHCHIDPVKVLKHEITHLLMEPFVRRFDLDHIQKEYVVETVSDMLDNLDAKRTGVQTG